VIAIIDYGAGNLASVVKAIRHLGRECVVTGDGDTVLGAEKLIIPGVALGNPAVERRGIRSCGAQRDRKPETSAGHLPGPAVDVRRKRGGGRAAGMGIFPGHCTRFSERVKSPHVGWNRVAIGPHSRLLRDIPSDSYVYFTIRIGRRCVGHQRHLCLRGAVHGCGGSGNLFGCNFIPKSPATSE